MSVEYKDEPCPGCGRKCVRYGKRICSRCESRLRRGVAWTDLHIGDDDYRDPISTHPADNELTESIRQYFRRAPGKRGTTPLGIVELADKFDCSPSKIKSAIENLQSQGVLLNVVNGVVGMENSMPLTHKPDRIDISKFGGTGIKFGVVADQHLCSRYARLDVLNALYDIFEREGVSVVYQLGNMIEGEARFNKFDLVVPPGVESQANYFVENWPVRTGIKTEFITGDDHCGWYVQREGINIGRLLESRAIQAGRDDLIFLGHMEHDIHISAKKGACRIRLTHPGGGTGYALSYCPQKYVESLQGGEKPNIVLFGHWHKFEVNYHREVWSVSCGTTQDQSPFMRKHKLQAHVGGLIISFTMDDFGLVHNFTPRFYPFFDRDFYTGKNMWKYKWN